MNKRVRVRNYTNDRNVSSTTLQDSCDIRRFDVAAEGIVPDFTQDFIHRARLGRRKAWRRVASETFRF